LAVRNKVDAILRTKDGGYNWDTVWSITRFGYKYGELVDIAFPTDNVGYSIHIGASRLCDGWQRILDYKRWRRWITICATRISHF